MLYYTGQSMYFSYDTCRGDAAEYLTHLKMLNLNTLSGRKLRVAVPMSFYPEHFRRDESGAAIPDGYDSGMFVHRHDRN